MQFSKTWLQTFCDPKTNTQTLSDTLTMGGFEVEEIKTAAPQFTGVVVGQITKAEQHPNADRLRVCSVDIGGEQQLQIVCGAPNARQGIKVACATIGAKLPPAKAGEKPFEIKQSKLRGVESAGMLCSAKELGISQEGEGIIELSPQAPLGQNIREHLDLDDEILTLKLTPNLGHALSVYGIARELSALTGAKLNTPQINPIPATIKDTLPVEIKARDLCGRFSGRIIKNINPKAKSPDWLVQKLQRSGQRSVSALVDISNYVMFEYGRPTHIFDLDKIQGGLTVRWSQKGEQLELLNGQTITLDDKTGVITDQNAIESLAGIMGGQNTAVSDDTKNIYIEAAFWYPDAIAGRARQYNFTTDAAHRFERGVDPAKTVEHIQHITALIQQICGTEETQIGPIDDQSPNIPKNPEVKLRLGRATKIIGMPIGADQCENIFTKLNINYQKTEENQDTIYTVTPPTWRFDIKIEEDLIEEIIRIIGYANLPETPVKAPIIPRAPKSNEKTDFALRHQLAQLGYLETINYSFIEEQWEKELTTNKDPIKLTNPIASQMSTMRSSLIPSLLNILKHNTNRRAERVRIFEIGKTFIKNPQIKDSLQEIAGIEQTKKIAALAYGTAKEQNWQGKQAQIDFYDIKGELEELLSPKKAQYLAPQNSQEMHPALHPNRSAKIIIDGKCEGWIGELHPSVKQKWELPQTPVLFEINANALKAQTQPQAAPIPRQLSTSRDIAIIVDEKITHEQLMRAIKAAKTSILQDALLFDIYRPKEGEQAIAQTEKSLAVRLTLGDGENTPTDEQLDKEVAIIIEQLQTELKARQRV